MAFWMCNVLLDAHFNMFYSDFQEIETQEVWTEIYLHIEECEIHC